jgi:hypothetical protein
MTETCCPAAAQLAALLDAIDPETEIAYRQALAAEAADAAREQAAAEGWVAAMAHVKQVQQELIDGIRLSAARSAPAGTAWLAAVARHQGSEYGGQGRPRARVPAQVIARAWRQQVTR